MELEKYKVSEWNKKSEKEMNEKWDYYKIESRLVW